MDPPTSPDSLPNSIADSLPKQATIPLGDACAYIDALLKYRRQPIETDTLPADSGEKGPVTRNR